MKEYFSHDMNARGDIKIKQLIRSHGYTGYGVFWAIVEDLYVNANALPTDYEGIAYELRQDSNLIESVINDFGLFTVSDGTFSSESVSRRLELMNAKSAKARESALKRWKDANAKRTQCDSNALKEINIVNKPKESKETKEKFTRYMTGYLGTKGKSYDLLYEEFKKSCKKLGSSVDVEVEKIPDAIQAYKANVEKQRSEGFKDLKYKNASTWLNNQCWLEEYEDVKKEIIEC